MKKILFGIVLLASAAGMYSCHKLDLAVTSELTPETFPQTEAQFNLAMGPVYVTFRSDYSTTYFFLQSMSTDESVLPIYGADWIDG
ncbi:MAG: RagB/SusD family nutrient uptake outer membrane protein, partial [Flavisolibacter sp.]|nr:RagB/SusD family nutrient uptake outer membrane protein [Flavisolibacter sp.]